MPFFPMADYKQWMKNLVLTDKSAVIYESIHQRPFDVYFAGTMQEAKGLSLCLKAASSLLKSEKSTNYNLERVCINLIESKLMHLKN